MAGGCAVHPPAIDDPRGRDAVRARAGATVRSVVLYQSILTQQPLRAARANRDFRAEVKRVRAEITVMEKCEAT